ELKQCQYCQLIFANLKLSENDILEIYKDQYFAGKAYLNYAEEKKALQLNFQKRIKEFLPFIENPKSKSLFEIGSAYGFFLELAKKKFHFVAGVDVNDEA